MTRRGVGNAVRRYKSGPATRYTDINLARVTVLQPPNILNGNGRHDFFKTFFQLSTGFQRITFVAEATDLWADLDHNRVPDSGLRGRSRPARASHGTLYQQAIPPLRSDAGGGADPE